MITKNVSNKGQVQIVSLDQLVPEDHILRKIDRSVDFSFIYDLVEDKYSSDNGRPSIDIVKISWHIFLKDITDYAATSKVS